MSRHVLAGPLAAAAIGLAAPAFAANLTDVFSQLYVFGDSLSDGGDSLRAPGTEVTDDPGNLLAATTALGAPAPPPPYVNGRFSDGPVWSDRLIAEFEAAGRSGRNFAFGGARAVRTASAPFDIPDFADQRELFESDPGIAPGPRPLAVVYFGGNDLFAAITGSGGDPAVAEAGARAAADEIGAQIRLFDTLTVNDFAIVNVGDIGATPLYAFDPLGTNPLAPLKGVASLATMAFNDQLSKVAAELRGTGRRIVEVDAAGRLSEILSDPAGNGFLGAVTPCGVPTLSGNDFGQPAELGGSGGWVSPTGCVTDAFAALAGAPANSHVYPWFDGVHPNSVIQAQLAGEIRSAVSAAVPLPAPLALLGGGVMLLAGLRRHPT